MSKFFQSLEHTTQKEIERYILDKRGFTFDFSFFTSLKSFISSFEEKHYTVTVEFDGQILAQGKRLKNVQFTKIKKASK